MQNPLAALLPIAPVTEAGSPSGPTDVGDGSFGATFDETIASSETVTKPDDAAGVVSPSAWGGVFLASPAAPPPAEADVLASDSTMRAISGSALAVTVEPALDPAVEGQLLPVAPSLASSQVEASTTPDADVGPVAGETRAARGRNLHKPSSLGESLEATGAVQPQRDSEATARNGQQTGKDGPVAGAAQLNGIRVSGLSDFTLPGPAAAAIAELQAKSGVPAQPLPPSASPQSPVGQGLTVPVKRGLALQDASNASSPIDGDPLLVDPSNGLSADAETDQETSAVSFWERVLSHGSASAPTGSRPPADASPNGIVSPPAAALIDLGASDPSQPVRGIAIAQTVSAAELQAVMPSGPTLSKAAAWSRQFLGDVLSKTMPQMVFADWQDDLSLSDQQPELSLSALPVLSGGTASGSPSAAAVGPHFPVPHIASQIASVLVRNDSNMTELALSPEELGKVRLRMEPDSSNPDRMVILISVERPETLDLFRRHAGDLAEAIRSAGYSGADIGFGQSGQENGSGHRRESASAGPGIPFEDIVPVETARPYALGASLDLRL